MANADYFLKIKDIPGESQAKDHKDEIEVLSFSWGAQNSGSSSHGTGAGSGVASVQDFHFTMVINKASAKLFDACCTGKHIADGVFVARRAGGTQLPYLTYKFTNLLISSYQTGGSGGGGDVRPVESISFNFEQADIDYQQQNEKGEKMGAPVIANWNVKQRSVV